MTPTLKCIDIDLGVSKRNGGKKKNLFPIGTPSAASWHVVENEKEKDVMGAPDVSRLPKEVWVKVFCYLSRTDLLQASSTSRAWRRLIFNTPRLWRFSKINLRCSRDACLNRSRRPWLFYKRMGHFLRRLKITCLHPHTHRCRYMAMNFRRVIRNLGTPDLKSFQVIALNMSTANQDVVEETAGHLARILRGQQHLRTFQMPGALWPESLGSQIFDAVVQGSPRTLTNLKINNFFTSHDPREDLNFQKGLLSFSNLSTLSIDYFYLSDETVTALAKNSSGKLTKLTLFAKDPAPGSRNISTDSWKALMKACPDLKTTFVIRITTLVPSYAITDLLNPSLCLHTFVLGVQDRRMGFTRRFAIILHHISKYFRKRLVNLCLDLSHQDICVDQILISLVRRCKQLQKVQVLAHFHDRHIERKILDMLRNRRHQ